MDKKDKEIMDERGMNLGQFVKQLFTEDENQILKCKKYYSTGFPALDEALGGGLTSGLHCLGSIPSVGKSTFMQQIAENMSASGIPVLFFSLDAKMIDIAAKAVSRWTYINSCNDQEFEDTEKTTGELLNKECFIGYAGHDWEAVSAAAEIVAVKNANLQVLDQSW